MRSFSFKTISAIAALSASLALSAPALAKVEGDTITLGAAISPHGASIPPTACIPKGAMISPWNASMNSAALKSAANHII